MRQSTIRKLLLVATFGVTLGCATARTTERRNTLADARPEEHQNDPTKGSLGVTATKDGVGATRVNGEQEKPKEEAPVLQTGTTP